MRQSNERGIAMITTLLVLMLISALLIGFTTVVMSDQRYRFIDRDRGQAFYAASGAMEKATADLGNLFFSFISPSNAQVTALTATPPSITGITYSAANAPSALAASELSTYHCVAPKTVTTVGTNGYTMMFCGDTSNNPTYSDVPATIKNGAFQGLMAQKIPYQIDVTARTSTGGEVHLIRTIEGVAIPVFQFGMFSDVDLSFFAGPNFNFGGRVHTNGTLYLSEGTGATLTLSDKVTAVKEVIRQNLQNGVSIDANPAHAGTINLAKAPGVYRALDRTEGSLVGTIGSAQNEPTWHTISLSTYNGYIRNTRTGAKALNLPLLTVGGTNPDLVRRPPVNENNTNAVLYNERMYTKASLRILLSDTAADITGLPGIDTTKAPVLLDGDWATVAMAPAGYTVSATNPPIARSLGPQFAATTTTLATAAGDTTISVTAVPAMFLKPQLTLKDASGNNRSSAICTNWTETQFKGCTIATIAGTGATASGSTAYVSSPLPTSGTALLGPGNMPGNGNPSVTISGVSGSGTNKVISLNAGLTTFAFAANTFFLTDVNGDSTATAVTCAGASATQFTNCVGTAPFGVPATSLGATITTSYLQNQAVNGTATGSTIGGYIKIERQDATFAWHDVTTEILNYGIGGPNLDGATCADPTPNAILRIQRLRDNSGTPLTDSCPITNTANSFEYWPNVLFDTREGTLRDNDPGNKLVPLSGVMYYIALDAGNLSKWYKANVAPYTAGTGAASRIDNTGYTVYFSDRRNNRNALNVETGELGFEDVVNPTAANGAPNGVLDVGEDVNANTTLETYGQMPNYLGVTGNVPPGASGPLVAAARAYATTIDGGQAQVNRAIVFRRALKLINGNNLVANINGLTVVSENPVYIQGDWNANLGGVGFTGVHAATSVIADAVTLLSNGWNDVVSFDSPFNPGNRNRGTETWYRVAIIGGKGMAFPQPAGTATDFGTDGGAHNFLRYLENGDQPVDYLGSIATFYYSRQAVGTYKCCTTVYGAPTRNYNFDVDFLDPTLMPPNTPVFRDMNAVGFSQELRPSK